MGTLDDIPGEFSMVNCTRSPLKERQQSAGMLLDTFSELTAYQHGTGNRYVTWLRNVGSLDPEQVVRFLCFWYPVSRYQPQILLLCAAAYPDWADRQRIMWNYLEEDGQRNPGDDPHYDLLEKLINKLGGRLVPDAEAESLVCGFRGALNKMTPAEASGLLAGVEHPALDISTYLRRLAELCGFADLLRSDLYLTIHVDVEPDHIVWSHGTALRYMKLGHRKEVVRAYRKAMSFWQEFWPRAFSRLDYPHVGAA